MDPLSVATSIAGLLSLTVQLSQILYNQVQTVKNAPKDAEDLLAELKVFGEVLSTLESFLRSPSRKGLVFNQASVLINAIKGCETEITGLKLKFVKIVGKKGVAQLIGRGKWYFESGDHQEVIATLHRYLGIFQLSVSLGGIDILSQTVDDVAQEISGLKSAISASTPNPHDAQKKSQQLDDILKLLSPISAMSIEISEVSNSLRRFETKWQDEESQRVVDWLSPLNFWPKQDDTFARKQSGTGEWLFDDPAFRKWLDGTDRTLWCPGIPGVGKTVLISAVIEYLGRMFQGKEVGIAFICCNYKEQTDQTILNIIASLAQQLIQRHAVAPSKLCDLYMRHNKKKTRPTVAECADLLNSEIAGCSKVFIVIDALDECDQTNGTQSNLIIELEKMLRSTPSTVQLLITSRNTPSIDSELYQSPRLEIRAIDSDIRRYLEEQIEKGDRLKRHIQAEPSLRDIIVDTIVEKAKGMFLLAQLHMESLQKKQNRKAVRVALENLPTKLDDTYNAAMERISNQDEDDVKVANRILSCITHALEPLTVQEIQVAVTIESGDMEIDEESFPDEELLISVCAGLTTIDRESNVIRLVHYTTQEYFSRNRMRLFPDGQDSILMTCLTYLSFDVFTDCYCSTGEELCTLLEKYHLLRYASKHWGHHASNSSEQKIFKCVIEFLVQESRLAGFVQVMDMHADWRDDTTSGCETCPKIVPAIWVAAAFGLTEIVRHLIEQNSNVNAITSKKETALHGAAEYGHVLVVQLLLENGVDIELQNVDGWTAVFRAVCNGHEAVIRLLVERGANMDLRKNDGETLLMVAATMGHKMIVQLLLELGVDMEVTDEYNETAVALAAYQVDNGIMRLLLEKGADTEVRDCSGWTLLQTAASKGLEERVQLLLKNGADVNGTDGKGWTPLHSAVLEQHETIVRRLLENGADINAKSEEASTPLHMATTTGDEAILRLLLENDADTEIKRQNGWTTLHIAAFDREEAIMHLLLEKGANPNAKDDMGRTALYLVVLDRHEEMVKLLLGAGADANITSDAGRTALIWRRPAALNRKR